MGGGKKILPHPASAPEGTRRIPYPFLFMDTSQYKALFLQEAEEHLQGISAELLQLEAKPDDTARVDNLFRHFHSIKGMAASMGYESVASFSHQLEDVLDAVRKKRITLTQEIIDTLIYGSDTLRAFIKMIEEDKPLAIDTSQLLSKVKAIVSQEEKTPSASSQQASAQASPAKLGLPTVMKVEGKVFDNLMGTVGELFTVGSRLKEFASRSYPAEFQEAVHQLGRTIESLNHAVITARMIPFEDLTQNLPRIVRDMCKKGGKDVELIIQGGDVRLDRAILEHITDPLVHIIRNAVDHGIETPDERKRLGKDVRGRITIAVARQRDNILVEISDDGRGIDINRLKEKALQAGVPAERLNDMPDKELLLLVCLPGVSLAREVTETSGRGVGMDVVKENVKSIGGRLEIDSYLNKGTKIILELPVTISIMKVLLVSLGEELFALPLSKVSKVVDVNKNDIKNGRLKPHFLYNDRKVPLVNLRNILMMPPIAERAILPIVIIDTKDRLSGIVVDDFEGEIDAYIKPLSQPMARMHGIIGVTVLGDGRPVFLIDPPAIL
ncbi:MAG: chemotaxis protein CheA [Deltaproteobacteria bacterium]|nr:chemotaxis protein CheA [Deltaproteobacteria bacterium]